MDPGRVGSPRNRLAILLICEPVAADRPSANSNPRTAIDNRPPPAPTSASLDVGVSAEPFDARHGVSLLAAQSPAPDLSELPDEVTRQVREALGYEGDRVGLPAAVFDAASSPGRMPHLEHWTRDAFAFERAASELGLSLARTRGPSELLAASWTAGGFDLVGREALAHLLEVEPPELSEAALELWRFAGEEAPLAAIEAASEELPERIRAPLASFLTRVNHVRDTARKRGALLNHQLTRSRVLCHDLQSFAAIARFGRHHLHAHQFETQSSRFGFDQVSKARNICHAVTEYSSNVTP